MQATLLVLSGTPSDAEREILAAQTRALSSHAGEPVVLCGALLDGVRTLVASGARRIVVLSLPLTTSQDASALQEAVRLASRRWPFLEFHAACGPNWTEWSKILADAAPPDCGSALITAPSSGDPQHDANLGRLAWLVERRLGRPTIGVLSDDLAPVLARCGDRRPAVIAWLGAQTPAQAAIAQSSLVECLAAHHAQALADKSLVAPDWGAPQLDRADDDVVLQELERKIDELLPPLYQGRYEEVSPQSMGSAGLIFAADGSVAWDKIWTSFCDLAMAGGPAHRGTLLEAVTAEEAMSDRAAYESVLAELERGIRLVTALPLVRSRVAGWLGIQCDSEAMAIWMLRAILVENVMARRENDVLYLPVGPRFSLKREIKNVVTVVAKTHHYWTAHRAGRATRRTAPPSSPPTH